MSEFDEEKLNIIFNALSHETRRKIIKFLGEKGKATYSELMNSIGINDSGTFAFHIRRMRYLINKDRYGNYFLTDLGKIGYEILENIEKPKEILSFKEKTREEGIQEIGTIIRISGRLYYFLSKDFLEKLKRENRKLMLEDILELVIDKNVTSNLFKNVVLEINDALNVHVPKHLLLTVESRCKDVLNVKEYEDKPPTREEAMAKSFEFIADFIPNISRFFDRFLKKKSNKD